MKDKSKKCVEKGCKNERSGRSQRCESCKANRRKEQMAEASKKFAKNRKAGKAGHALVYDGRPTAWALANRKAAIAEAKKAGKPELAKLIKEAA